MKIGKKSAMKEKLKIFVSAYACEPNLGSEIGVGWHWVLEMSKKFELWVLTRESNRKNIEDWIKENKVGENIHFLYFDLPPSLRFWKKGLKGVRLYYIMWQKLTNKIVKETMIKNNIEIYHHLTYGNSLWPVSNYGMKQFFIWGPTGGVDSIPREYSKYYSIKSRIVEFIRRLVVASLPINYGFRTRCKHANLIFCKSYSLYNNIPQKYRDKAVLFTDVAVEMETSIDYINNSTLNDIKNENNSIVNYIVVGKLDAWRGFDILIEAFSKAVKENSNIRLDIIGDGSESKTLNKIIEKLNMKEYIKMSGKVSRNEYYEKMYNADVIVNSSLKEGAVTVSFDSMAFSKPMICIDTGGYTRYFNDEYAIVLDRIDRKGLINNLSKAIIKMTNKELRKNMGQKAFDEGCKYTWEDKGNKIYKEIMKAYGGSYE